MDDLGNKAKHGIKAGFDFLKGKAKDAVETNRLHSEIKKLQARRDEYLLDIGHRVFVMFEMDKFEPESLKARIDEIRELNRSIEAHQEEAQALRHGMEEKRPEA